MQALPTTNECLGAYGATCGEPIPELKGVTRFSWTMGSFGASLRHRFVDSVTTDRYLLPKRRGTPPPALETFTNPELDSQNYFDLSLTYDIGEKAEVYAGVNNVFGTDPPIIVGQGGYANTFPATYDYAGRTMFIGFNLKSF